MRAIIHYFLVGTALLGCAGRVDVEGEERSLVQADTDFAEATAKRGADGWADFFASDGVMYPPSGRVEGREAIRERMQSVFTPENPRLVWEPVTAEVGAGGDLGYTLGRWRSVGTATTGTDSTLAEGNYVTIWRKVPGEGWRVAVDIGNRDR